MAKELTPKKVSIRVSDSIGTVSGMLVEPAHPKAVIVLAHGAGAGMIHPFMSAVATELAERDVATLRYNFPFTENKKGRPDPPAIAEKTVQAALEKAHELFPDLPLFAAGKSFGGRMSSQRLSKDCPTYVKGIIFYGFPLHAPGKPGTERAFHLQHIAIPMLFLQGTRDALATWELIEKICSTLPSATLARLEGADHSFKSGKKVFIPELVEQTVAWLPL